MKTFKKIMYYVLEILWAFPTFLIGSLAFIGCKIAGCPHFKYRNAICVMVGEDWGGWEAGIFFFVGRKNSSCCPHEYGHSIQMLWWGPLFLLVIGIPSAIRYWYRSIVYKTNPDKYWKLPKYDDIWFEGQATRFGNRAANDEWDWL